MEIEDKLQELLNTGKVNETIACAEEHLKSGGEATDNLYYLLGNAYRKKGDWQHAIDNYLEAMSLNPESPAKQAYSMAMDILNFFNKDMYNQ